MISYMFSLSFLKFLFSLLGSIDANTKSVEININLHFLKYLLNKVTNIEKYGIIWTSLGFIDIYF